VTSEILANFTSDDDVPPVNMGPRGPHPAGSFEVWVPTEHLGAVTSYMMLHRGETSLLLHPLSLHCVEDHTGRIAWFGVPFNIDRTVLAFEDPECDSLQYPELGLGYSAP
jgi:DOPA 4,5-dioxygenase